MIKFAAFEPIDIKSSQSQLLVEDICLSKISPNPEQPRKIFDKNALHELAISIKKHGVIQPIIVQQKTTDQYEIIAGERRWRAAKIANLSTMPAIVYTNEPAECAAISLIENIQRQELNPIEIAQAFKKLNIEHGLSHESIALMVGKSRATVTNLLRLLNLSPDIQEFIISGKLEMGHARALLTVSKENQIEFIDKIISKHLSVREAEKLVKSNKKIVNKQSETYANEVKLWVEKLSKCLSIKVSVDITDKGEGRLIIPFSSPDEVDCLIDLLQLKI